MILGAIALLILALALVAAELVVPTHGVLAIFAGVAAAGSVFLAYRASSGMALLFAAFIFAATPVVFYYAVKLYPRTAMGKRVMLSTPVQTGAGGPGFAEETEKLGDLVGQQGEAMTMLRPAGSIAIGGKRIDAISEAEMIEAGTRVEVIRVAGMKVIVKAVG